MNESLFKEVIKDLVLKYIQKDDLHGLISVLQDDEIFPGIGVLRKEELNFGWPDFLQSYLDDFYKEIIGLEGKVEKNKWGELMDKFLCLDIICMKTNLYASYGFLKGQIGQEMNKLKLID